MKRGEDLRPTRALKYLSAVPLYVHWRRNLIHESVVMIVFYASYDIYSKKFRVFIFAIVIVIGLKKKKKD